MLWIDESEKKRTKISEYIDVLCVCVEIVRVENIRLYTFVCICLFKGLYFVHVISIACLKSNIQLLMIGHSISMYYYLIQIICFVLKVFRFFYIFVLCMSLSCLLPLWMKSLFLQAHDPCVCTYLVSCSMGLTSFNFEIGIHCRCINLFLIYCIYIP